MSAPIITTARLTGNITTTADQLDATGETVVNVEVPSTTLVFRPNEARMFAGALLLIAAQIEETA